MKKNKSKNSPENSVRLPTAKAPEIPVQDNGIIDEAILFERVTAIIENRKLRAAAYANSEVTLMFWEVGQYINSVILNFKRATYGKQILKTLSVKLTEKYGKNFAERNIYRMTLFAERFSDVEILPTLSAKLSWSHIIELLSLKSTEAQLYYAQEVVERNLGVHELRRQIARKAYERREIANTELSEQSAVPFNVFKDPYLLDMFALKDNFLEADLEKATIGIILCASANREKIELLEMDKAGITVAEYWTHLPPKALFEAKIKDIMAEAKERLERRKSFPDSKNQREFDYFIEPKNSEEE